MITGEKKNKGSETPVLRSFNQNYEVIEISDEDEFCTIGKVVECRMKF